MTAEHEVRVIKGSVLAYRLFDVGAAIDLERAQLRLASTRRARLGREGSEALAIASPPLDLTLGPRTLTIARTGETVTAETRVRLFDYGAASVRFEIPIAPGSTLLALLPLADELYNAPELEGLARAELATLLGTLGDAVEEGRSWTGLETYTVLFFESLEGAPTAAELIATGGLDRLLLGETAPDLSREVREDVLRHALSYRENDLAVIDWNSAFVLEPSGSHDIPDVLEFATSQLLEMRYYDAQLDVELAVIHKQVAAARQSPTALFWSPWGRLARAVLRRYLELIEFTERVDNSLKVIGDLHLARLYQTAVGRFRTAVWRDSVYRKQELLARVYSLLNGEIATRRSVLLEVAVVLLILIELLLALAAGG